MNSARLKGLAAQEGRTIIIDKLDEQHLGANVCNVGMRLPGHVL